MTNYEILQTDLANIFEPVRDGFSSVTFDGYDPPMSFMARTGDAVNPNADGYYKYNGTILDAHPKGYLIPKTLSYSGTWGTQQEGSAVNTSGITFTVTYMDGTTETVTPSVSPANWAVGSGSQTATFSYTFHGITVSTTKTCNMTYTWSTASNGNGTVSGSGTYTYSSSEQTKTISATPDANYALDYWTCTGGTSCSASGTTLTIAANCRGNIIATATFRLLQSTITMATNNSSYGTASIDDATYMPSDSAQTRTLSYSITNSNIYQFDYWTTTVGTISGNTLTIPAGTMQDFTVTAHFSLKTFSITVTAGSGGSASGSTTYQYSTSAQTKSISYSASSGYTFSSWSVSGPSGGTASASGTTLTIGAGAYGNITVTANFTWYAVSKTISGTIAFVSVSGLYTNSACTTAVSTGVKYTQGTYYYRSNSAPSGTYLKSSGTGQANTFSGSYQSVYSSWVSSGAAWVLCGSARWTGNKNSATGCFYVHGGSTVGCLGSSTSCTLNFSAAQMCYNLKPFTL